MWQGLIGPESFLSVITILAAIHNQIVRKKPPIKKTMLLFFLLKSTFV